MKRRIIVCILLILLVLPIIGCSCEKNNDSSDSFHIEFDENGVPVGAEVEVLPDGTKRWLYGGDHYHYAREDDEKLELKNDSNLKLYVHEVGADMDCILDKLNIDESLLDMKLEDFVKIMGLETIDIEQVINECTHHNK